MESGGRFTGPATHNRFETVQVMRCLNYRQLVALGLVRECEHKLHQILGDIEQCHP